MVIEKNMVAGVGHMKHWVNILGHQHTKVEAQ